LIIEEVWFSSPERSRTAWKLAAMDDTSSLELKPGHIRYIGGKARIFGGRTTDIHAVLTAHLRGQLVFDAAGKQGDAAADLKTSSQFQDGRKLS
jgi:hypothetical protein